MDVNKTFHFMATEPQKQEKKSTPTLESLKALSSLHNCSAELKKSSRFRAIFQ